MAQGQATKIKEDEEVSIKAGAQSGQLREAR